MPASPQDPTPNPHRAPRRPGRPRKVQASSDGASGAGIPEAGAAAPRETASSVLEIPPRIPARRLGNVRNLIPGPKSQVLPHPKAAKTHKGSLYGKLKKIPVQCNVCIHPQRSAIEQDVVRGLRNRGEIATFYCVSPASVRTHATRCMPTIEAKLKTSHRELVAHLGVEGATSNPFLARQLAIEQAAWGMFDSCKEEGDKRNAVAALSVLSRSAEMLGKGLGLLIDKREIKGEVQHGGVFVLAVPQGGGAGRRPVLANVPGKLAAALPAGIEIEAEAVEIPEPEPPGAPAVIEAPKPSEPAKMAIPAQNPVETAPQDAPGRIGEGEVIPQHPPKSAPLRGFGGLFGR